MPQTRLVRTRNPYCNVNLVAGSSAIHEAQGTDFVFTPQHQLAQS
ncbi:Uncharacterised protein [Kocuria rosea]|nr:Uncharacterised protein [Kocuria rosea]